ncbi:hypothetical protein CSKR_100643 [Clonorchis sinensis]|uniref:Uncharacterized protein n=1 Tax=Clonorchis sinensis TaxID=79923 RepID=A0A3R7JI39_CLOSI|nr:hypothetical protein CSKR_100643 [Clonorchis sinensis]
MSDGEDCIPYREDKTDSAISVRVTENCLIPVPRILMGPSKSNNNNNRSVTASFRCLAAMSPEGSTRSEILQGCPSLGRSRYLKLASVDSCIDLICYTIVGSNGTSKEHDLKLCGCRVYTKRRDDFGVFIQKYLRLLLLFEGENDFVCIFRIDKVFVSGCLNIRVLKTFHSHRSRNQIPKERMGIPRRTPLCVRKLLESSLYTLTRSKV